MVGSAASGCGGLVGSLVDEGLVGGAVYGVVPIVISTYVSRPFWGRSDRGSRNTGVVRRSPMATTPTET